MRDVWHTSRRCDKTRRQSIRFTYFSVLSCHSDGLFLSLSVSLFVCVRVSYTLTACLSSLSLRLSTSRYLSNDVLVYLPRSFFLFIPSAGESTPVHQRLPIFQFQRLFAFFYVSYVCPLSHVFCLREAISLVDS